MAIIAKRKDGDYSNAPEGLFPAVCIDVIDLGLKETPWGPKEKIAIKWSLDEKDEETGKNHTAYQQYTLSLGDKANLRKILEAWRGKKFSKEELEGFDVETVIGANCQVQIQHNLADEGKVYANVVAVVPAPRGAVKMAVPADYVRECDKEHRAELESNPNGLINDEDIPF